MAHSRANTLDWEFTVRVCCIGYKTPKMTAFSPHRLPSLVREQQRRSSAPCTRVLVCGLLLFALCGRIQAADDVPPWLKPLTWANPESSNRETAPPPLPRRSRWLRPLWLRADTRVAPRQDEYTANEPHDFEQIAEPFYWENPQTTPAEPEPKTDAERIEYEKQHFAWIRPFYWDNTTKAAAWTSLRREYVGTPEQQLSSSWLKPFTWSNASRPYDWSQAAAVEQDSALLAEASQGLYRLPPINSWDAHFALTGSQPRTVAFMYQENTLPAPKEEQEPAQPPFVVQDEVVSEPLATSEDHPAVDAEAESLDRLPFEDLDQDGELEGEALGEGGGLIADAESLGTEPEDNYTLQFLRADTVLLDPGQVQFDYGFTYTLFDTTFPWVNSSLELEHARFRQRELLVPLEIRYGLARRLQLFANVPFGWSNIEFSLSDFELFENDGGIGDVVFGGTFLVRQGDECNSDLVWTAACSAPTGVDPFEIPSGQPGVPSLGNGAWSLASNLLWIRNYDPVVIFYGFGTRQFFTRDLNGQSFRPGQEYNYQLGVGFAVNSKVTFSTRFNGAYITEPRLDGTRFLGTIREPMSVSLATTIAQCKGLVEPFVDFGLTDESIEARFGVTWTRF